MLLKFILTRIIDEYACTSTNQLDARSAEAWLGRYGMMIISYIDILTRLVIRRVGITISIGNVL